jgi:predicted small integral membrane protein
MLIYTRLQPQGTTFMVLLGIPFYVASLLFGLAVNHKYPGAYIGAIFSPLLWSFTYTKLLVRFLATHKTRQGWKFVVAAMAVQTVVVAAMIYAVAA